MNDYFTLESYNPEIIQKALEAFYLEMNYEAKALKL